MVNIPISAGIILYGERKYVKEFIIHLSIDFLGRMPYIFMDIFSCFLCLSFKLLLFKGSLCLI